MSRSPPPISEQIFRALLPDLRRSARRLCRTQSDADDLVQDTFLRVWARLARAEEAPISDLRAYAFATLRHGADDRARRASDAALAPEREEVSRAAGAEALLTLTDALTAMDRLPPTLALALRLRAIDGLSYRAIAERTGWPMGTVTSRLARARRRLRTELGLARGAALDDVFLDPPTP